MGKKHPECVNKSVVDVKSQRRIVSLVGLTGRLWELILYYAEQKNISECTTHYSIWATTEPPPPPCTSLPVMNRNLILHLAKDEFFLQQNANPLVRI